MRPEDKVNSDVVFESEDIIKNYMVYTVRVGSTSFQYVRRLRRYFMVVPYGEGYQAVRRLTQAEIMLANPYPYKFIARRDK